MNTANTFSRHLLAGMLIIALFFGGIVPLPFLYTVDGKAYASVNKAEREYVLDSGPITGSTTANYVYTSFFNPSGSGSTASIKRIAIRSDTASSTASNYVNLTVRRISAASAGTQITAANFPQKNASSTNSILEVRHTGVTVTLSGTVDSRLIGMPLSGAVGGLFSKRDVTFASADENIVLQPGEGIAVYQEAAGTAATKVRVLIEWDETANAPSSLSGFIFAFPRVEVAATNNYVYNSFFNPSGSGKTARVRRIWFGSETCDAAAVYTNNMVVKRISAASAGTAVAATNVPKKHTGSADSVMEFRHTNVTATQVGGTAARLLHVSPCGTTAQPQGWQELTFHTSDEQLILQQGEGIALISEGAGNANHLTRMIVEWDEVTSAPSSEGEYLFASDKVAAATAINTTLFSFFNPVGSGKTAVVNRLVIRGDATTTSAYTSLQWRRTTAASGGTLITASDLPKKHTSTADSIMEMRWCLQACSSAITVTYVGTAESRLLSVTGAGAVGQTIGDREIVFGDNEKIVLQPGEGIALYNDVLTSSAALAVKVGIEWGEQASPPAALGEYLMDIGPVNGNTATTYNYISIFNPSGSGKTAVFKRLSVRVDTVAAAVYVPIQLRRITASSGGTSIASSSYPEKHTGSATSTLDIRITAPVVTYAGATTSALLGVQTPGAVASAIAGNTGYKDIVFTDSEPLVLKPGEGVVLYQTPTAGDADLRVRLLAEWGEQASTPTALNEYMMTVGPVNQSLTLGYVYATLFNPSVSAKNYLIRKLGMQVDRSGAATVPTYTKVALRRISAASAGTLVATTSIMKNTNTASSTAEVRSTNVTATLVGSSDSRIISGTAPGVVNQVYGDNESTVRPGDDFVLKPGEGVALYQEEAQGDANTRYHFFVEWDEESNGAAPQTLSFSVSTSTIYFGPVSSASARYASSTNVGGSASEVDAHTVSVTTNATNGYTVTVKGQTLTAGASTISAIGATAAAPQIGVDQFGIRLTASGGSGTSTSPYNGALFAYGATATTSSQVASASIGDNATTTFSVKYLVNVAPITVPATYTASLIYVATANF